MKTSSVSVIALTAVSACGGGGHSPVGTYLELSDRAQAISPLAGKALVSGQSASYVRPILGVSGNLKHTTTGISINVADVSLTDVDGPDAIDALFSSTSLDRGVIETTPQNFDYVMAVHLNRPEAFSPPGLTEAEGFIGVATNVADIPTLGRAVMNGIANGTSAGGSYNDSLAVVDVSFALGSVNLAVYQTGDEPNDGPRFFADGLDIDGNKISGGTTIFGMVGEDQIDLSSMEADVQGQFFGYDADSGGPDEVGIAVSTFGTEGSTELIILAD